MSTEISPTSALRDWQPTDDVVVYQAIDHGTGIRQDDELVSATELIHTYTSQGTGILVSPTDVAQIKMSSRDTYTPQQLSDAEFEVRFNLTPAVLYDRGKNGRRIKGTMLMPLNTDTGVHTTDSEYIAFVNLEGSISGQRVGRYGVCRIQPKTVDRRGVIHKLKLNNSGYVDGASLHPGMIEGFIKGFAHLEDAIEAANELRQALTTIRNANHTDDLTEEREFIDRTAPENVGY